MQTDSKSGRLPYARFPSQMGRTVWAATTIAVLVGQAGCALRPEAAQVVTDNPQDPTTASLANDYRDLALIAAEVYESGGSSVAWSPSDALFPAGSDLRRCDQVDPAAMRPELQALGWQPAENIERYPPPTEWRLATPELAVSVWRKPNGMSTHYAIGLRGTAGPAGWLTNLYTWMGLPGLPFLTSMQDQARTSVNYIVRQIRMKDPQGPEPQPRTSNLQRARITLVGHSLGAALAVHAAREVDGVDEVVGINPLVDATLYLRRDPPVHRADEAHSADTSPLPPPRPLPPIRFLSEAGELLDHLRSCPHQDAATLHPVRCDRINLSRGSALRQHRIDRLACKLHLLARQAQDARPPLAQEPPPQLVSRTEGGRHE
jgi:thioesterase domain-containing protein